MDQLVSVSVLCQSLFYLGDNRGFATSAGKAAHDTFSHRSSTRPILVR